MNLNFVIVKSNISTSGMKMTPYLPRVQSCVNPILIGFAKHV